MASKTQTQKNQDVSPLWNLILARGLALGIVGIVLLVFPSATLTALIIILGAWWLIDGITTLVKSIKGRKQSPAWGWGIFTGILGVIAGIVVLSHPLASSILTTSFLVWFLGIAAVIYGINGLVTGIRLRKEIHGEWSMIVGGLLSIIIGIILMVSPYVSALTLVKTIGVVALVGGLTLIILAYQVRKKRQ